jgi:hypothetical protein
MRALVHKPPCHIVAHDSFRINHLRDRIELDHVVLLIILPGQRPDDSIS